MILKEHFLKYPLSQIDNKLFSIYKLVFTYARNISLYIQKA